MQIFDAKLPSNYIVFKISTKKLLSPTLKFTNTEEHYHFSL